MSQIPLKLREFSLESFLRIHVKTKFHVGKLKNDS